LRIREAKWIFGIMWVKVDEFGCRWMKWDFLIVR